MSTPTALLIAQSLLSQWFLFFEVPQTSLDQLLPALSSQVEISTGSMVAPLQGMDAVIAFAEQTGPTQIAAAHSHDIRELRVLDVTPTRITAEADVIYRQWAQDAYSSQSALTYSLTFILEGDHFRIARLVTRPNPRLTIPATAPAPATVVLQNQTLHNRAHTELERAEFTPTSLRNEVEAFVGQWYCFFDLRPAAEGLDALLAPNPIQIFMFQNFTDRDVYLAWYRQMRQIPMLNAHRVHYVDIRDTNDLRPVVELYITWESEREGQLQTLPMRNTLTLQRDADGHLRAQAYTPGRLPF